MPVAIALDRQRHWLIRPGELGDDPATRPRDHHVDVEALVVRAAVQCQPDNVRRVGGGRQQVDDCTARADIRLADGTYRAALTGDGRAKTEPVDPQIGQPNVEAGQDRALGLRRTELRQAVKIGRLDMQSIDIETVGKPAQRIPVEIRARDTRELALGVREPDVAQSHGLEDLPLDGADAYAKACHRLPVGNLPNEEAVPGLAVQPARTTPDRQQQSDGEQQQPLADPRPGTAPARQGCDRHFGSILRGSGALRVGHQKA